MITFCVWKNNNALQAFRRRPLADVCWQRRVTGADALLVMAGQTPPKTVLRAAVVPESLDFTAKQLVTYGAGPRSTVTVSSVGKRELWLCLQREIVNLQGERLDQQEILLPVQGDSEQTMAYASALLLAGLKPDELAGFFTMSTDN